MHSNIKHHILKNNSFQKQLIFFCSWRVKFKQITLRRNTFSVDFCDLVIFSIVSSEVDLFDYSDIPSFLVMA